MKATHSGTCQWCGRVQLLPGGRLANHGYEITHGFQQGTCSGSGHHPFETHTDLIQDSIEFAKREADRARKDAVEHLSLPLSNDLVFHLVYHRELSGRTKGSIYLWERGAIRVVGHNREFVQADSGFYREGPPAPVVTKIHDMGDRDNLVRRARKHYADSLTRRAIGMEEYAEHQAARLVGWTPQPLKPRKG